MADVPERPRGPRREGGQGGAGGSSRGGSSRGQGGAGASSRGGSSRGGSSRGGSSRGGSFGGGSDRGRPSPGGRDQGDGGRRGTPGGREGRGRSEERGERGAREQRGGGFRRDDDRRGFRGGEGRGGERRGERRGDERPRLQDAESMPRRDADRPRREGGSIRKVPPPPPIPEDVEPRELDRAVRAELRTLPKELAEPVARHLVMVGRLLDDDPDEAYRHAVAARRLAARVGAVREAAGLAAYASGNWSDAITDLRAALRLGASNELLPVIADCERGLGRPERALALATSPEASRLDESSAVEMRIVASGARRDLGQADAAVVALQGPDLQRRPFRPWSARLFYAYADALEGAGRSDEAREWLVLAAQADTNGETDAAERLAEMDGITFAFGDDETD